MITKNRHLNGFTLVEVISSIVVMALSVLALMRLFSILAESVAYRQHSVMASNLAQRKMEEVKAIKKNDFNATVIDLAGSSYSGFPQYTLYVWEAPNYLTFAYLKRIDVTVSWGHSSGGTSSETISTVIADY